MLILPHGKGVNRSVSASKLHLLLTRELQSQMPVCLLRHAAPSWRPRQKAALQKIGLIDVFERHSFLVDGRRKRIKTDRASAVILDDAAQHSAVERIQTELVDLQPGERLVGDLTCDHTVGAHLRIIAHPAQKTVCDTRRAAGARGDLVCPLGHDPYIQDARRANNDTLQLLRRIELETQGHAEAVAQRRRQLARARRGADQREMRQIQMNGVGRGSLSEDDVDGVVKVVIPARSENDAYYTLQGVRVDNPTAKGVYIHNGKKVIIK